MPVPPPEFRRSSYCHTGSCLEVAEDGEHIIIRDSTKADAPPLIVTRAEWDEFVRGVKNNEFDFPRS
ncbi:hypothetical protein PSU4_22290 [Pseudonocardia sulfidoxydans NBRC 16205]|uniref:DUF397 domain-containing protein n=1 Tax=Pseudonocardia sulfidoxydans NBRC 16205 TaxID=1223511 RepID=A0A511DEQ5_9PSEU|nr:DUF397 domain-containing protein [Pseudonocardia sulfidoxydans]GEL23275.1 hypothetical protein PSU4_22290 [Pseudonocardia sulfidoxydans NBRC 16205]